jgi:ABC-type sugar transport system permease subunit
MIVTKKLTIQKIWYFLPGILIIGFIFVYPIFRLFLTSFQYNFEGTINFVGSLNYKKVLNDPIFFDAIKNNVKLIILVVPLLIFMCLSFSVIIYNISKLSKMFQIIIFIPYILSITVTGILFSYLLQPNGILNELLRKWGLNFLVINWLGNNKIAIYTIGLIIVWKEVGFGTILFISRLNALSHELVDAIKIDGANWVQIIRYLYIPHLRGIMIFYATLIMIYLWSWVFNYIYIITGGGLDTMVFEYYTYNHIFVYNNKYMGTAGAVIIFIIIMGIVFFQMKSREGLSEAT